MSDLIFTEQASGTTPSSGKHTVYFKTDGYPYVKNSAGAEAILGVAGARAFVNRLINGGFTINQRNYATNTALAAGVYAHDRWKAGAGGCTYTFTQPALGVPCAINITAGTLQQVIEGCNLPEGGSYTLQWAGTAQAQINGGGYGVSPLTVAALTAGSNITVELNAGTISGPVQLEPGNVASPIDYRAYQQELLLCMRYCQVVTSMGGVILSTTQTRHAIQFTPVMRATPATPTFLAGASVYNPVGGGGVISTLTAPVTAAGGVLTATVSTMGSTTAGMATYAPNVNALFSAEL